MIASEGDEPWAERSKDDAGYSTGLKYLKGLLEEDRFLYNRIRSARCQVLEVVPPDQPWLAEVKGK